jgi:hypothetical protein
VSAAGRWLPGLVLLVLGLLRMAAELGGLQALAGVAAATGASPAPKVFSVVAGLETYSTRFLLEVPHAGGAPEVVELTPARYAALRGPYNRRNAYGALLAYAPALVSAARTRPMFDAASRYALCGDAPLLRELGIDTGDLAGPVRLRLVPRAGTRTRLPLELEVRCP